MPRFEYKTLAQKRSFGKGGDLRREEIVGALNDYGAEGWELVTITLHVPLHGEKDGHLFILKRQVAA
jgi:hypothetical protein